MAAHARKADRQAEDDHDAMIIWSRTVHALAVKVTSTEPQVSIMIELAAAGFESLAPVTADALRKHARELGCSYAALQKGLGALEAAGLIEHYGDGYRIAT